MVIQIEIFFRDLKTRRKSWKIFLGAGEGGQGIGGGLDGDVGAGGGGQGIGGGLGGDDDSMGYQVSKEEE